MAQKNICIVVVSLLSFGFPFSIFGQSIKNMRINEIQVYNTNGLRDDYGQLVGWIELFNTGYNKVDISGCVLKVNGKEYRIPKGDPNTVVSTRGYCLFYAGGDPNRGTFYTNFTLDNTDFIELYDVDGYLIDSFRFDPAEMNENVSYGWFVDKDGVEKRMSLPATTPGSSNETEEKVARAELFRQADPIGIVLTITSIFVVACSLVVLFFIFKFLGDFQMKRAHKKVEAAKAEKSLKVPVNVSQTSVITNDELVAIAIALYKYSEELHDIETTVLTINRAAKVYSPWSSKIYGLTQLPNKK